MEKQMLEMILDKIDNAIRANKEVVELSDTEVDVFLELVPFFDQPGYSWSLIKNKLHLQKGLMK